MWDFAASIVIFFAELTHQYLFLLYFGFGWFVGQEDNHSYVLLNAYTSSGMDSGFIMGSSHFEGFLISEDKEFFCVLESVFYGNL